MKNQTIAIKQAAIFTMLMASGSLLAFDCVNVQDVSQSECEVLKEVLNY